MKSLRTEKLIAYLALFSGLLISAVAEFYSIVGLTAIFPTAFIPIVIMGIALGAGKLVATVWLKQNWSIAPYTIRAYLLIAIFTLMFITSMGIFGFLSKAHSDQGLVSGDVQAKIAVYDEKIKTAKENIDANRKALKQMDEAVDQVMGRSQDSQGADKAVAIRRGQAKERTRLLSEITAEQKVIAKLSEERAPIAAEVRKVEAEVGPIKYIAKLIYSDNPDANILEKAVSWVIVLIVIVFDPMAVILLLSSQISFQRIREQEAPMDWQARTEELLDIFDEPEVEEEQEVAEVDSPEKESDVVSTATVEKSILEQHPYLTQHFSHFEGLEPMVYKPEPEVKEEPKEYVVDATLIDALEGTVNRLQEENDSLRNEIDAMRSQKLANDVKLHGYSSDDGLIKVAGETYTKEEFDRLMNTEYVQNEEQRQSGLWKKLSKNKTITEEEYLEKAQQKRDDNTNNAS